MFFTRLKYFKKFFLSLEIYSEFLRLSFISIASESRFSSAMCQCLKFCEGKW